MVNTYVKIEKATNGFHDFQTCNDWKLDVIPDGWAIVLAGIETPNFPYGEVETEIIDALPTVTKWTALPIPEPTPVPYEETELDQLWEMEADHEERLCLLELGIAE